MRTHSKIPLFLMELIVMLLVFSVSAGICLQVFAGAKRISEESKRLDAAVIHAQTVAEYWKANRGNLKETASMLNVVPEENGFILYDKENCLRVEFTCEGSTADIVVLNGDQNVFSVSCEAVMADE